MIILKIPLPPSVNALFANVPGKGRVKTEAYRTWINAAGWSVAAARPAPIHGAVSLDIVCERKDNRRRDISNLVKATEDLLVRHGVIEDDSKVIDLRIRWGNVSGCIVTITSAQQVAA